MKSIKLMLVTLAVVFMCTSSYAADILSYGVTPAEASRGEDILFDAYVMDAVGAEVVIGGEAIPMNYAGDDYYELLYTIPDDAALGARSAIIRVDGVQASVSYVVK
jgi:hypothetical protein